MPLNILWTGGWDSTFRVLQAALVEEHTVQPYYLIDVGRDSTLHELRAMNRIRPCANARCATERILPVRYHTKDDIPPDPAVSCAYEALKRRMHLGTQYEWLGAFIRHHDVEALELGIVQRPADQEQSDLYNALAANVMGTGHACRLAPAHDPALGLFSGFRFPTFHITKADMGARAKRHGFRDLMNETWFCHTPILGEPCGQCAPCTLLTKINGTSPAPPAHVMVRRMLGQAKRYFLGRLN